MNRAVRSLPVTTALALALVLSLAGCTGSGVPSDSSLSESSSPVASSLPAPAATACTPTTVGTSDLTLKLVSLSRLADRLRVRFLVSELPKSFEQNLTFLLIFRDADGTHGGVLLSGKTAGETAPDVYESADDSTARRLPDVTPTFGQDGSVVTDYPSDLIKKLHTGWTWKAMVNLDGEDIATCGGDD